MQETKRSINSFLCPLFPKHSYYPVTNISPFHTPITIAKTKKPLGGSLYFFTLPALDPVPTGAISPIRGVSNLAVDETALNASITGSYPNGPPPIRMCVLRKKAIAVCNLRERLQHIKVRPLLPSKFMRVGLMGKCGLGYPTTATHYARTTSRLESVHR